MHFTHMSDAISAAKKAAKDNGWGYAYVIRWNGSGPWQVAKNKPTLRPTAAGAVIEVTEDGETYHA